MTTHRCAVVAALAAVSLAGGPAASQSVFVEPDVHVLYTLQSGRTGDTFGWAGEKIGDLDGDNAPEFAITAWSDNSNGPLSGAAYVYSGRTGLLIRRHTGQPFSRFGLSVAGAGDVNRDGTPDYMIGAPGSPAGPAPQIGRVIVFSGETHEPILEVRGEHHLDIFGFDINEAGDLNQDGYPDIVVGSRFFSGALASQGAVAAISGFNGTRFWTQRGVRAVARLGSGVSGIDDVTGDGIPDVAAGADGDGPHGGGRAYVYSGADGTLVHTLTPNGSTAALFGQFFAHDAGDVDADGIGDVYVADYAAAKKNGIPLGQAYVFSGVTGERIRTFRGEAGDSLGGGRGIGDINGDGHDDLLIPSFQNSSGAPGAGKMEIFSGKNGAVLRRMTGAQPGVNLGVDALPIGDVNADGKTDMLITAFGIAHVIAGR